MGWSDEVHANRMQLARRKNGSQPQYHLSTPQPRKSNAGSLPIVLITGAVASAMWIKKNGSRLSGGRDPLAQLGNFFKRLIGGSGRKLTNKQSQTSTQWKNSRPGSMAAAAAAQRAQVRLKN